MAVVDHNRPFAATVPPGQVAVAGQARASLHWAVKVYLVIIVLPFAFSLGPVVLTGVRCMMAILFIPMFMKVYGGKLGKVYPVDYLFLGHVIWIIVSMIVNNPDQVVQNAGATSLEFLGGYLLGRTFIRSKEDMIGLFRFATFLVACTLPLALYETLTGDPLVVKLMKALPFIDGAAKVYSPPRMGLDRVQMGFASPIHYGLYCTLAYSACFIGLRNVFSGVGRLLSAVCIGFCVFFSLSSGALLPLMMQSFLIGWDKVFRSSKSRWWLLFGFFVFCYVTIDLLSNRTPYRVFMTYATFSPATAYYRAAINQYGMENVWMHPIFGNGLNGWIRPNWLHGNSVDNYWLLMAMRHGIPAFLLVASGYSIALLQVLRKNLGGDPVLESLRLAWLFTVSCIGFTLVTVHIWTEIYSYVFFFVGSAIWMLSVQPGGADAAPATAPDPGSGHRSSRHFGPLDQAVARPATSYSRALQPTARDPAALSNGKEAAAPARHEGEPRYSRFPAKQRE